MLPVSLDCPFVIVPSVFSYVYCKRSTFQYFLFRIKLTKCDECFRDKNKTGVQCIIVFNDEAKFEIKITILFDDLPASIVNFMIANVII